MYFHLDHNGIAFSHCTTAYIMYMYVCCDCTEKCLKICNFSRPE